MNIVLRKEKKYLLNLEENYRIKNYLEKILIEDSHNGIDGYMVRSLYFDTLYEKDFQNKQDGVEIRRKIRLRIYDLDSEFAFLEIKQKQGENQLKRSLKLHKNDVIQLIKCNYSVLLKYENEFAKECYALMTSLVYRPKAVVQYNRKAFIAKENNIRITFDSNIIATESNFDIFSKDLNMYTVFDLSNTVLEVKYNGFLLSYIKNVLNTVDKTEVSVSKYCLARKIGLNYII